MIHQASASHLLICGASRLTAHLAWTFVLVCGRYLRSRDMRQARPRHPTLHPHIGSHTSMPRVKLLPAPDPPQNAVLLVPAPALGPASAQAPCLRARTDKSDHCWSRVLSVPRDAVLTVLGKGVCRAGKSRWIFRPAGLGCGQVGTVAPSGLAWPPDPVSRHQRRSALF